MMFARLDALFDEKTAFQITLVSLVLVAVLAVIDYFTGYEMSFSIFYLVPTAFATWYGGLRRGIFLATVSATVWFLVDRLDGHLYSRAFVPYWNAGVRFMFFMVTVQLLATIKVQLQRERVMARIDGLTGVMNGRAFREAAQPILRIATRYRRPIVMGYIDIDNFKGVNDTLGHTEGDRVLRTVSAILLGQVRRADLLGRMGGDEFAFLLPETTVSGATTMFQNLREKLLSEVRDAGWPIGFSIGVAVFHSAPSTIDEAIRLADALMYRVKNGGKNTILCEEYGSPEKVGQ